MKDRIPGSDQISTALVADSVYDTLRRQILLLERAPGSRLRLEELAARFAVSQTPVRLAIGRLLAEGLAVTEPHRGARVAGLTFAALEEIQAVRAGVEPWLAIAGVTRLKDQQIRDMSRSMEAIRQAYARHDLEKYLEFQSRLHDICYQAADKPRLLQVAHLYQARAERYLRNLCKTVESLAESRGHQEEFFQACRAHDVDRVDRVTREAMLWTLDRFGHELSALGKESD